jgi:hypothetical protein
VLADAVVRWRPSDAAALETVVDLGAEWSPATTLVWPSAVAYEKKSLTCDDAATSRSVDYWMHASGVSTAFDADGAVVVVSVEISHWFGSARRNLETRLGSLETRSLVP